MSNAFSPYVLGQHAALERFGLEKTAAPTQAIQGWGPAAIVRRITGSGAATTAPMQAETLLGRLGNTQVPLKALAGMGVLAGGAMLAHHALSNPTVEVHPSLPMRTMFA